MSDTQHILRSSPSYHDIWPEHGTRLLSGTPEPIDYTNSNYPEPKPNITHNLIHHNAPTTGVFTASPLQTAFVQEHAQHARGSRLEVVLYLLRKTSSWVLAGIIIMLLGIGLLRSFILPRIYTCPASATCSGSWDPSQGSSLQLLQSFTVYCIKFGLIVASVGLLKLSSYQAWFILMHQGNSVKNLDLTLGAIRGSVNDAALLLLKKNNHFLSIFVFGLIGIGAAINLVVGLSISTASGTQSVMFTFNGTTQLPDSSLATIGNDGQLRATERMVSWSLDNDQNHSGALKGTLVTPDARSSQASNALPGGPTMHAWFECQAWDNYTAVPNTKNEWYIWVSETRFIALSDMSLAVSMFRVSTAVTSYLWVSNTTGLIPNATTTSDGGMNIALCTHYYEMVAEGPRQPGVQYLIPTVPLTSGCKSHETNPCIADSVNNAVLNWWGGVGTAFWFMSCRGGLLGPTAASSDEERYCPITQDLFQATASGMLDAIIQTSPTSVEAVQQLRGNVSGLNGSRWWLNVTIPAATLVIYLVGLAYTCVVSRGDMMLKELNLEEVVRAAQSDHVHDLVLSGLLKGSQLRYDSDVGFVNSDRNYSSPRLANS